MRVSGYREDHMSLEFTEGVVFCFSVSSTIDLWKYTAKGGNSELVQACKFFALLRVCLPWLRFYPDWGFFRAFSSVVRYMPGCTSQRRVTVRTLPNWWIVLFCVLFVSIVLFCVLFVCKCVRYSCHRMATHLQLNISSVLFNDDVNF
jgi:hypothetical protein